jgi:CRP-like cAMP-binding protein
MFIFSGGFRIYMEQQDSQREMTRIMRGEITGVLPYSRLKISTSFGQALEVSSFIQLHRSHFREMITDHHTLTEALVHHMSSRIRNLTTMTMQNEKLMSLGKLSAGLAHELKNSMSQFPP